MSQVKSECITHKGVARLTMPSIEMIAGILIALPWIAVSWYSKAYAQSTSLGPTDSAHRVSSDAILERTCILTAAAMLLIGCAQVAFVHGGNPSSVSRPAFNASSAGMALIQVCAVGMPVYAALKVGGFLVAFVLLLSLASGMPSIVEKTGHKAIQERFSQKKLTVTLLAAAMGLGFWGVNTPSDQYPFLGYAAIFISVFILRPPFLGLGQPNAVSVGLGFASSEMRSVSSDSGVISIISGMFLAFMTVIFSRELSFTPLDLIYLLVIAGILAATLAYLHPTCLRSPRKFGLVFGTGVSALLCSPPPRDGVFIAYVGRGLLAAVSFVTARFDDRHLRLTASSHHHHHHHHHHIPPSASRITKLVLHYSEPYPLLYSILQESDSRRIFYFMTYVPICIDGLC